MPPKKRIVRKNRPPRVYIDERDGRYYIIQDRVRRYFKADELEGLKLAISNGTLTYKTKVKSKNWKDKFPKQDIQSQKVAMPIKLDGNKLTYQRVGPSLLGEVRNLTYRNNIGQEEERLKEWHKRNDEITALKKETMKKQAIEANIHDSDQKFNEHMSVIASQIKHAERNIKEGIDLKNNGAVLERLKEYKVTFEEEYKNARKYLGAELIKVGGKIDELKIIITPIETKEVKEDEKNIKESEKTMVNLLMSYDMYYVKDIWRMVNPSAKYPQHATKAGLVNSIFSNKLAIKSIQYAINSCISKYPGGWGANDFTKEFKDKFRNYSGAGDGEGLYSDAIEKMMSKYDGFLGVIANDQIGNLIESSMHYDKFGFVINSDNSDKEGSHWMAIYVDLVAGEVDFYDSLVSEPSQEVKEGLKEMLDAHDINYLVKMKVNKVKQQDDRSDNCGWFAMKFLIDRFNGKTFVDSSGWSETRGGEKKIKVLKSKFGYI